MNHVLSSPKAADVRWYEEKAKSVEGKPSAAAWAINRKSGCQEPSRHAAWGNGAVGEEVWIFRGRQHGNEQHKTDKETIFVLKSLKDDSMLMQLMIIIC